MKSVRSHIESEKDYDCRNRHVENTRGQYRFRARRICLRLCRMVLVVVSTLHVLVKLMLNSNPKMTSERKDSFLCFTPRSVAFFSGIFHRSYSRSGSPQLRVRPAESAPKNSTTASRSDDISGLNQKSDTGRCLPSPGPGEAGGEEVESRHVISNIPHKCPLFQVSSRNRRMPTNFSVQVGAESHYFCLLLQL